jgi:hypothetical protein
MHEPPPSLAERRPDLPPTLDAVVGRALAKTRDERYASCSAFLEAARDALRSPAARPAARSAAVTVVEHPPTAPPPSRAGRPSRRRWLLIAAIAAVLAGAGAAAAVLASGGDDPSDGPQAVPRLAGRWDATATIEEVVNIASEQPGDTFVDTWTFAPTCASGLCDVTLRRDFTGTTFTLTPSEDGRTFTGSEGFKGVLYCPDQTYDDGSTYLGEWTVRIVDVDAAADPPRATRIEGRARIDGVSDEQPGCPVQRSVETFTFTATPAAEGS